MDADALTVKIGVWEARGEMGRADLSGREKDDDGRRRNAADAIDGELNSTAFAEIFSRSLGFKQWL